MHCLGTKMVSLLVEYSLVCFYVIVKLWLPLSFMMWRFQNKQVHHREQQTERVDRDGQRSRSQNAASSGSSNGTSVNSVNNRVSGFSRTRDARDGDEYTRSEQHLQGNLYEIVTSFPWLIHKIYFIHFRYRKWSCQPKGFVLVLSSLP